MKRYIFGLLCLSGLYACTATQSTCLPPKTPPSHWRLKARVALKEAQHKKHLLMVWEQKGLYSKVLLMDPLGLRSKQLKHSPHHPWTLENKPLKLKNSALYAILDHLPYLLTGQTTKLPQKWQINYLTYSCTTQQRMPKKMVISHLNQRLIVNALNWSVTPPKDADVSIQDNKQQSQ